MMQETSPRPSPFSEPEQPVVEDDFLVKIGAQLPSHLKTRTQRWGMLLLASACSALAAGPLMSWPTLEPLLISEGVWAGPHQVYKLSSVCSIASGAQMISLLLAGVVYDVFGPRVVGVGGAVGAAVCLWVMAIAVKIPQLNNLLWVAYPACSCLGLANAFSLYAWLWLLPENQGLVAAISGATQTLADSFCLIAVLLNSAYGVPISTYFVLSGVLALLSAIGALIIPSHEDMCRISKAVNQSMAGVRQDVEVSGNTRDYGAVSNDVVDTDPIDSNKPSDLSDGLSKVWSAMQDTYVLATKVHPIPFFLFSIFGGAFWMFNLYPSVEMYPFYVAMVGTAKAIRLVDIFGGLYAVLGTVLVLVYGQIADLIGLPRLLGISTLLLIVNTWLFSIPSLSAQVGAQILLTFLGNAWTVLLPTFLTAYAPPEILGTAVSVGTAYLGIAQIVLTQFGTWAGDYAGTFFAHDRINQAALPYLLIIDLWSGLSVLTTILLLVWWWYNPMPMPGEVTMDQVKAAIDPDTMGEGLLLNQGIATLAQRTPERSLQTGPSTCCDCLPLRGRHLP